LISGYAKLADHTSTVAMINSEGAPLPYVAMVLSIVVELGGGPLYRRSLHTPRRGGARRLVRRYSRGCHSNWVDLKMKSHFLKNLATARGFA
jgi:hypothetical protein